MCRSMWRSQVYMCCFSPSVFHLMFWKGCSLNLKLTHLTGHLVYSADLHIFAFSCWCYKHVLSCLTRCVYMQIHVSLSIYDVRGGCQFCCLISLYLISLRQSLSLNEDGGLQPAPPSDLLVPSHLSTGLWAHASPYQAFYMSTRIQTQGSHPYTAIFLPTKPCPQSLCLSFYGRVQCSTPYYEKY